MNLEKMRAAMEAARRFETVECPDIGTVKIKQLDAAGGMRLASKISGLSADKDPVKYAEVMSEFFVDMVSKCIVDDDGGNTFDSEEGRKLLAGLRFDQLTTIGNACMALNGMTDEQAKKN